MTTVDKSFCDIHTKKTLADKGWRKFFSRMNKGTHQLMSASIYEKDERPLLLFHIGPHKTGSTAIQCSLTHFYSLLHSKESFTFLGRSYSKCQKEEESLKVTKKNLDTRSIVDCLDNHAQDPCDKTTAWKNFEKILNPLYSTLTNVIISDEAFARVNYTSENLILLHSLLTKNHRTRIVITYRDYSEWVVSKFNEEVKKKYGYREGLSHNVLFPNIKQPLLTQRIYSVLSRGLRLNNANLKNNYFGFALEADIHPTDWFKRLFGSYFDDVVVFNMHTQNKNSELATSFLSSVVPVSHTISSATLLKIDKWVPKKPNKSINIDYAILADAAYSKGMIKNKNVTLKKVTTYITKRCEETNATYFMKCITKEEQDYLFRLALSFERKLFPGELHDKNENH